MSPKYQPQLETGRSQWCLVCRTGFLSPHAVSSSTVSWPLESAGRLSWDDSSTGYSNQQTDKRHIAWGSGKRDASRQSGKSLWVWVRGQSGAKTFQAGGIELKGVPQKGRQDQSWRRNRKDEFTDQGQTGNSLCCNGGVNDRVMRSMC